jgi:predicted amidohydrolase YtcJ
VRLALGSDCPVTPVDPWGAVRAAVRHRTPGFGLSVDQAFEAHTSGGWFAAGSSGGTLAVGEPATFAVWDRDGLALDGSPACLRTVRDGKVIYG